MCHFELRETLKVLIEYSVYIEENNTVDVQILKETEQKIIGADKMDEIVKFTILIKLNCLKHALEKEDLSVLENIIRYLRNVSPLTALDIIKVIARVEYESHVP